MQMGFFSKFGQIHHKFTIKCRTNWNQQAHIEFYYTGDLWGKNTSMNF